MQQTTSRKFSIIESSDPFLPEALNDNTRKIEAALDGHEARTKAVTDGLDQRVTVLESPRIAWGQYTGNDQKGRIIPLPFTPKVAMVVHSRYHYTLMATGAPASLARIALVENGIQLLKIDSTSDDSNITGNVYFYLAFC